MKTSERGRKLIEKFEGLYLKTYLDSVGIPTIGYGHTTAAGPPKVKLGDVITKEEADIILRNDLFAVEQQIANLVKVPLSQNQFDALVSFQFNTGGLGRSTLLKKLNAKKYDEVPSELMKWTRAGGQILLGLVRRRKAESELWMEK